MEERFSQEHVSPPAFFVALFLIGLVAFSAIWLISAQVLEHVPHSEDEVAYLFQARVFAENRLSVPTPDLAPLFWSPFVVDYQGQRFGKYAPGWPLLLSLGVRLGAPWVINALLGVLSLIMIGWLGRCLYGPKTGLLAAGLGLLAPGFLVLSSSLLSHAASLFWTTLALVALVRLAGVSKPGPAGPALLVGLALGAAFVTRPFAAVGVGLAVGVFLLFLTLRGEIGGSIWAWLVPGGLVTAGLLPLYWWAVTGDPGFNAYLLVWPYDRTGFGPDVGPYGYSLATAVLSTRLKLEALALGLFGWPGYTNLLFLPLPFLLRRANRWDWLLLGTLAGLVCVHFFYWAFGGVDGGFPRYYYDALPALLLLTSRGVWLSGQALGRWRLPVPGGWTIISPRYAPLLLLALLVAYTLAWSLPAQLAAQQGKYGITAAQLRAVERAGLAPPALVLVKNVTGWRDFAAPFAANSPTLTGPIIYAIDGGPQLNARLQAEFPQRACWELAGEDLKPCPPG